MAKIRDGSTYLEQHLCANDYYCEQETVTGRWQGQAAKRLGLHGVIRAHDPSFARLRENRHPEDGSKLTPRDGTDRVRFYDFQCSAQKSVSIMAVTLGDTRLLVAHDLAASIALTELEKFAGTQANTALQRQNRITGNLAAAVFRHTASRALDPQVHTHHVVANATWDEATKSWRALSEYEMVRAIRYAGKVYQNELAKSCLAMGYDLERVRDGKGAITGFELAGVPVEIRSRFSKRRAEVEQGIREFTTKNGRGPTTAEVHAITIDSRNDKLAEITTPAVIAAQRDQLSPTELETLSTLKTQAEARQPTTSSIARERESIRLAVGQLYERRSVLSGHEILAEALNQNLGEVNLPKLHAQAAQSGLVSLGNKPWLRESFATRSGLRQERWAVEFIRQTNDRFVKLGRPDAAAIAGLSAEQRRAVGELLASRDQVVCLRGAAGAGKTTILKALLHALKLDGQRVHICAPTTSAVETLRHDDMTADTVAGFLAKSQGRQDLRGAILVVDEAGLASNRQGAEIIQLAERHKARVIFLGDSRQHTSVEAGDFLRILEMHAPLHRVELTDIRRQTVAAYRNAVRHMASGLTKTGLERLDLLGWVKEGRADYLRAAVSDFLKLSHEGQRLDSVLAVTPTWEENNAFTDLLRNELKTRGVLQSGEIVSTHVPLPWTKVQLTRAANYSPGLVVIFDRAMAGFQRGEFASVSRVKGGKVWLQRAGSERCLPLARGGFSVATAEPLEICPGDKLLIRANAPEAKLINGQTLTVASVRDGQIETVEGRCIDTNRFRQFTHGFAVTSHRSQSKTCDHVVVAAARMNAKAAYVACSRGRLSCTLHTPDKAALLDRLPEGKREAGLDFPQAWSLPLNRAPIWERAAQERGPEAGPTLRRSYLRDPWWRGLLHGLAEWGRSILPGHPVDIRSIERNPPHDNSRFISL